MSEAFVILTEAILTAIIIIGVLSALSEGIVEITIAPLWKRYKMDPFWLHYWVWAVALGLTIAAGQRANALATVFPNPWVGLICTALVACRGASFLHDIYSGVKQRKEAARMTVRQAVRWEKERTCTCKE